MIKIIDSIMGTGKTSYVIQKMNKAPLKQRFIFVTPFLSEVGRIKQEVHSRDFKEPATRHGQGSKLTSLKKLIAEREDIVTTHALFALADDELIELLEWQNYTLIIDEVMDVMEQIELRKDDIKLLIESRQVEINEDTKQVKWVGMPDMDTRFNDIMNCA